MEVKASYLGGNRLMLDGKAILPKLFKRTTTVSAVDGQSYEVEFKKPLNSVLPTVIVNNEVQTYHEPYPGWVSGLAAAWTVLGLLQIVCLGALPAIICYAPFYVGNQAVLLNMEDRQMSGIISLVLLLISLSISAILFVAIVILISSGGAQ